MTIPNWYETLLLAVAAWRVFHLLSEDKILDRPRAWILGYSGWVEGEKLPDSYRVKWGEFVTCPYCFGTYIGLAWWGAFQFWPHETIAVAALLTVLTGLVAVNVLLDRE